MLQDFLTAALFDEYSEFDKETIENEIKTFFTKTEQISFCNRKFGLGVYKLPVDYAYTVTLQYPSGEWEFQSIRYTKI